MSITDIVFVTQITGYKNSKRVSVVPNGGTVPINIPAFGSMGNNPSTLKVFHPAGKTVAAFILQSSCWAFYFKRCEFHSGFHFTLNTRLAVSQYLNSLNWGYRASRACHLGHISVDGANFRLCFHFFPFNTFQFICVIPVLCSLSCLLCKYLQTQTQPQTGSSRQAWPTCAHGPPASQDCYECSQHKIINLVKTLRSFCSLTPAFM